MTLKERLINSLGFLYALVSKLSSVLLNKVKMVLFYQEKEVIKFLADPNSIPPAKARVYIAIAHITSKAEASDREQAAAKVKRLESTLDGLLTSFAHCDLTIILCTVPECHIDLYLPEYQREAITVHEFENRDPLYIGFAAQDILVSQVDNFDWFLFIEDDIVMYDSWFLFKMETFNRLCGYNNALLFPNRYEMHTGKKSYIDLTMDSTVAWNRVSSIEIHGIRFSECTNPHSGMYCLSQAQMHYWINSGRTWKDRAIMVGPLESAATFCLMECFSIYKPHPVNLNYLEVRHFDTKYSTLLPSPSPYILSAVSKDSTESLA